jgi:hypothetical protein
MPYYNYTYGGKTLPFAKMAVTESPVYAEDKFTLQGTQYTFDFSGFLIVNQAGQRLTSAAEFGSALLALECAMTRPRQSLVIQWSDDGITWTTLYNFQVTAYGSDDNAWGPLPGDFKVTKFMGGRTGMYSWSVSAFQKTCFDSNCNASDYNSNAGGPILSITRRYQFDIDEVGLTTQTTTGKLTIMANPCVQYIGTPQPITADNFRYVVTPSLPQSFQRVAQSFTTSEDGRELSFSFKDQEMKYVFPTPITGGQANWSVRVEQLGALVTYSLSGRLGAPQDITKAAIIQQIANIALAKFPTSTQQAPLIYTVREITEDIYNNWVSFNIVAQQAAGGGTGYTPNFDVGLNTFTVNPPTNQNGNAWAIYPYGADANDNSGVIANPPVQFDTCTNFQGDDPTLPVSNTGSTGTLPSEGQGGSIQGEGAGTYTNLLSQQHTQSPYISYNERLSWEIDNRIVAFVPKTQGAATILQQTGTPQVTIIQAGYSVQYGQQPSDVQVPPQPFAVRMGAPLQIARFETEAPVPVGDGAWNRYTQRWMYVARMPQALTATNTTFPNPPAFEYPQCPQRPMQTDQQLAVTNMPALLNIPGNATPQ